jgi:hypothetical protein
MEDPPKTTSRVCSSASPCDAASVCAEARATKQGKLEELEKSVALVRENGGLNARMTQMLARQVGLLASDGPVVQASDDLEDVVDAAAASDRRTAKVHLQVLAGGVVCNAPRTLAGRQLELRVDAVLQARHERREQVGERRNAFRCGPVRTSVGGRRMVRSRTKEWAVQGPRSRSGDCI